MKTATRIYQKWQEYSLDGCDCKYCLYYAGRRKQRVICLADECVCKSEIQEARCRERRQNGS